MRQLAFLLAFTLFIWGCGDQSSAPPQTSQADPSASSAQSGAGSAAAVPVQHKKYDQYPKMQIDPAKHYTATLNTSAGKIVLELFASEAPKSVNNFVALSRDGFYNGTIFHRVIPGFMIQGGDPDGNGGGGPGYEFENENRATTRKFLEGTVGMANAGLNTNGSQFYIMDHDYPLPPTDYTIFGQLKEGQDVVHKIAAAPRDETQGSRTQDRPFTPIVISSITITEE
jgi:cyclophilin family peptidyl-prolyl cis-trans isomerase